MSKSTGKQWTVREDKQKGMISEYRFIIECNTNVPGIKGTVARAGYLPYARLMAAAPELLEACKEALGEFPPMILGLHPQNPTLLKLKRAIAKATPNQ